MMKTHDQIVRYTSHCRFTPEDWALVKGFCYDYENGGHIHKSIEPIADSTFQQFIDWLKNGFGSGDMVKYGNTMGIIGDSVPGYTYLVAYCDYDGNLITQDMEILEPERLKYLDYQGVSELRRKLYERKLYYEVQSSSFISVHTPQKKLYYIYRNREKGFDNIGMYCDTKGDNYIFYGFLENGKVIPNHCISIDCTLLLPASMKQIGKFQKALEKSGLKFNESLERFVKVSKSDNKCIYWYLNDRFEIVMDRDDGSKRHQERYAAGNYFLNYELAMIFMRDVRKMRKEG